MNEQKKLLRLIQNYSFALYETVLYLDSHPNCRRALQQHNRYQEKLNEAACLYEEKFGPLTVKCPNDGRYWQWVNSPWPWEYDSCD